MVLSKKLHNQLDNLHNQRNRQMNKHTIYKFKYTDLKGKSSEREVYTLTEAPETITVIDLSKSTDDEKSDILRLQAEYNEYVQLHISKLYKFEDWLKMTTNEESTLDLQIKKFKLNKIELV